MQKFKQGLCIIHETMTDYKYESYGHLANPMTSKCALQSYTFNDIFLSDLLFFPSFYFFFRLGIHFEQSTLH
jgi:hypothetical protein